ncbi:threonine--tRNA ligase [Patescibacteria group bacterium]
MAKKTSASEDLEKMRHSCAHVLAQAVLQMFPEAKLGFGPAIENGFYYDFELPRTLIPEDLPLIEKKMKHIIKQNQKFEHKELPIAEAKKFLKKTGQDYKIEASDDLAEQGEKTIQFWENIDQKGEGTFVDMCEGPHLEGTGKIKAYKLTSIAGAYWKGSEKNPMLQRIYGVCFENKEDLDAYLKQVEEAKKRDHRKLGKELELFTFDEEVGAGLPLWLPNGTIIADALEDLAKEKEAEQGYKRVRSPHIAKDSLYHKSGHLPYYEDSMYPSMNLENEKYYLKAMNCPHHHKIYAATPKSYKDLPLRLAEYGHCYRFEDSGALFGLMRVRSMAMNDAHIYCTEEQFEDEFAKVIDLYLQYFEIFGIEKYEMRLSLHSKEGLGKKYVDNEDLWIKTEELVRKVLKKLKVPFVEAEDEAAFYGPKIDVQVWSVIGREFTLSTNQLDFAIPLRFDLKYTDKDGSEKTPICIHRAPLSTHERMIGFLIEHYAGAFPAWLSPTQIVFLPVAEPHQKYAEEMQQKFAKQGIRTLIMPSDVTLGKRIREAEMKKIPYMAVIGDKELESNELAIRDYKTKKQNNEKAEAFLEKLVKEIKERK